MINLNWQYQFKFGEMFEKLNGIYTVTKIYSYPELIDDGINIWESLYDGSVEYNEFEETIFPEIKIAPIYKLVSVMNEEVILYIPRREVTINPDFNINKYYNLVVTWNVGVYEDKEQLSYAQNLLTETIEKVFGTEVDPDLIDIGVRYLTDKEFEKIEKERAERRDKAFTLFSENQRLRSEILEREEKIKALSEIIKNNIKE